MSVWILEPRDPLLVRDGRPFSAEPGARARSLPLPYPSVTAGCWRTLKGKNNPEGFFDVSLVEPLLKESITGPLLVELSSDGEIVGFGV